MNLIEAWWSIIDVRSSTIAAYYAGMFFGIIIALAGGWWFLERYYSYEVVEGDEPFMLSADDFKKKFDIEIP